MTDSDLSQLRQNLMAQFHQMVTEQLPPGSGEYVDEFHNFGWVPTD